MSVIRVIALCVVALSVCDFGRAKIYQKCELVRELRDKFHIPEKQVPTWTCIAFYESKYNTSVTSRPKRDGSRDHGLFQINDEYWCSRSPPGRPQPHRTGCKVTCAEVETDDITKAVSCVEKIWAEWQQNRHNGFKAWSTYKYCDTPQKVNPFVADC